MATTQKANEREIREVPRNQETRQNHRLPPISGVFSFHPVFLQAKYNQAIYNATRPEDVTSTNDSSKFTIHCCR